MQEKLIKPYRVNNIEFRPSVNLISQEPYYEIVKWYDNTFYGKDDEFEKIGGRLVHKEYRYGISENLLKMKETCFTLAVFEDTNSEEPDIRSVGKRPFELDPKENVDFLTVMNYGFDEITKKHLEDNRL